MGIEFTIKKFPHLAQSSSDSANIAFSLQLCSIFPFILYVCMKQEKHIQVLISISYSRTIFVGVFVS